MFMLLKMLPRGPFYQRNRFSFEVVQGHPLQSAITSLPFPRTRFDTDMLRVAGIKLVQLHQYDAALAAEGGFAASPDRWY